MKFFLIIFLFFLNQSIFSQELNSTVFINSDNIETSDKYIFEEMKVAFEQFLNNQLTENCNLYLNNFFSNLKSEKELREVSSACPETFELFIQQQMQAREEAGEL